MASLKFKRASSLQLVVIHATRNRVNNQPTLEAPKMHSHLSNDGLCQKCLRIHPRQAGPISYVILIDRVHAREARAIPTWKALRLADLRANNKVKLLTYASTALLGLSISDSSFISCTKDKTWL